MYHGIHRRSSNLLSQRLWPTYQANSAPPNSNDISCTAFFFFLIFIHKTGAGYVRAFPCIRIMINYITLNSGLKPRKMPADFPTLQKIEKKRHIPNFCLHKSVLKCLPFRRPTSQANDEETLLATNAQATTTLAHVIGLRRDLRTGSAEKFFGFLFELQLSFTLNLWCTCL